MKLFVWSGSLDTGAYHADGSAVVAAKDLAQAVELLTLRDDEEGYGYHYGPAAGRNEPTAVLDLADSEAPRVVALYGGCDC